MSLRPAQVALAVLVAAPLLDTACGDAPAPVGPPVIAALTATQLAPGVDRRVRVAWRVTNAVRVELVAPDGVTLAASFALEGSLDTTVKGPSTFVLTAWSTDATATSSVSITPVQAKPRIIGFGLRKPPPELNTPDDVLWSVVEAEHVRLLAGDEVIDARDTDLDGAEGGARWTFTADVVLRLEAWSLGGTTTATLSVRPIARATIWTFDVSPRASLPDLPVTVRWYSGARRTELAKNGEPVPGFTGTGTGTFSFLTDGPGLLSLHAIGDGTFGDASQPLLPPVAEVEPNDLLPQDVVDAGAVLGTIAAGGDRDQYRVRLISAHTPRMRVRVLGPRGEGCPFDAHLRLRDDTGVLENDVPGGGAPAPGGGACPSIELDFGLPPFVGTFIAEVFGDRGTHGDYALLFEPLLF